ncbi:MAG: glycosyltransferase family 2 protein [Moorea sp. SIO2I5]|nr:glycosyltransferase family 2 protein [Moorena sp. SIO2I5]
MKTVSIIIPVYGVEKYIATALKSVINQTYKNFEVLIIDDESPDKSVKICRKLSDNRINIIVRIQVGDSRICDKLGVRNP